MISRLGSVSKITMGADKDKDYERSQTGECIPVTAGTGQAFLNGQGVCTNAS